MCVGLVRIQPELLAIEDEVAARRRGNVGSPIAPSKIQGVLA